VRKGGLTLIITFVGVLAVTRVGQVVWWTHDGAPEIWWTLEVLRWTVLCSVLGWLYHGVGELSMRLDAIRDFSLQELAGDAQDEDVLRSDR
jgi:hypothetical protein